ncbi:MAG: glycosyltransferase, partial [Ginsengibacter sp.]
CIQSVIDQTVKDIEIIVVNDGSTDNSADIIETFRQKDNRIRIIASENRGVSTARNKGLEIATGEFVGFVDADDWIEPTMFESLYQSARENSADLVVCNVNMISEEKEHKHRLKLTNSMIDLSGARNEVLVDLMRFNYDFANWNKLYSSRIISDFNVRFPERLVMYEDLYFNLCYFQYSQTLATTAQPLYNYRIHDESAMSKTAIQLGQFNLLMQIFLDECKRNNWQVTSDIFLKEMRRGFYYNHLSKLIAKVRALKINRAMKIKTLSQQIRSLNNQFFDFQKSELRGVQGLKKRLLRQGWFHLFATLEVSRKNEL